MTARRVQLATPIAVIHSPRFAADVGNALTPFMQEVNQLAAQGVLPVTLKPADKGGWSMAVHTSRYVAWLYPTKAGDAMNLGHAAPRRFQDDERLLKGVLLVWSAHGFQHFADLRTFNLANRGIAIPRTIHRDQLWREWHNLPSDAGSRAAGATSAHARYLDLLDTVVEASRQIEIDRQTGVPPQHYVSRGNAREQRYSARGVYTFRLARAGNLIQNCAVCLGEARETRGSVIRVDGRDVTVRFEPGADFDSIGAQGTLLVLPSDRVYRAQRTAIAQLRRGEALNPRLLDNLVGASFSAYQPELKAIPRRDLDPDQLDAFRRAIAVPDILNVLGPPGAGKTTTIVEVIQACVDRGQRVLVTSHTNRAVDNVLENLPPDLNVVRIGSEDRMTAKVKAFSSESRVEDARLAILADTALLDSLAAVARMRPTIEGYLAHLQSLLQPLRQAEQDLRELASALDEAVKRSNASLRAQLERAERECVRQRSIAATTEAALARAHHRAQTFHRRAQGESLLARAFRWYAGRQQRRAGTLEAALSAAQTAVARAEADRTRLSHEAETAAAQDPEVLRLRSKRDSAHRTMSGGWPEVTRAGEVVRQILLPANAAPPSPANSVEGWTGFHAACAATLPMLERRVSLLQDWHEKVNDLGVELEREMARYADVVAATCIGTETSALISDLEFDLAIVDEAGQISTPNLLVPLVRSHRAMLVGDHKQLPPYLDEEVRQWADGVALDGREAADVMPLLAKSGFELLFPRAQAPNAVWLKTQRRMPPEIAEFVSNIFYFGRLRTEHPGGKGDPLFRSPFAMVDTADRPARERAETQMSGLTGALRHGYRNELEAGLIAELIAHHCRHYRDWAVIVPFNAQKELVVKRLEGLLDASARVAENVGSVDSFQGGERDLIVFGFTRSNPRGRIGFLKELRRFNVAITRARQQLVLVGDLETLCHAEDVEFRKIMLSMRHHLASTGDLRPSLEVEHALGQRDGRP